MHSISSWLKISVIKFPLLKFTAWPGGNKDIMKKEAKRKQGKKN